MKPGQLPHASDCARLEALLQHWRDLSQQETDAIISGSWHRLDQTHAEKRLLQQEFDRLQSTLGTAQTHTLFAKRLLQLFEIEQHNLARLNAARSQLDEQRGETDKTSSTLRTIQKAYFHSQRSYWHSYS